MLWPNSQTACGPATAVLSGVKKEANSIALVFIVGSAATPPPGLWIGNSFRLHWRQAPALLAASQPSGWLRSRRHFRMVLYPGASEFRDCQAAHLHNSWPGLCWQAQQCGASKQPRCRRRASCAASNHRLGRETVFIGLRPV